MMPELDGYGVLYLLSKREDTSLIPFIFITAKADRAEVRKGIEMGADDYLTKPFDDIELLNAIESRLKKKEHQKKFYSDKYDQMNHLFQSVNGLEELKKSFDGRKIKTLKRKQIIYTEGDTANAVYLILSGSVKTIKMTEDGRWKRNIGIGDRKAGLEEFKETLKYLKYATLCSIPRAIMLIVITDIFK
jgi:response regulator RpfG family c-di-GMP phosphodiesterase